MSEEKRIPSTGRFERSATSDWPRGAEANVQIEEQYRLIVEIAYDAIISIDEHGQILFANPSTERIFGYDPAELVGRPLEVLMPESLRPSHRAGIGRYCRTHERHINWRGVEMAGLRKDGTEFPIEVSFGEITRDGRPLFIGFVRASTERRQAETLLAESHLLRTLIDNMPDYIYVKDTASRFLVANRHLAEVLGLKGPEGLIGKTDFDFFPKELAAAYLSDEQAILQSGQALVNHEEKTTGTAGSERWFLTTKVPLRDSDGKVIGIVGVGRDITPRKQAELALRRANDRLAEEKAHVEQTARELKLFRTLIDESNDAIEVVDPQTLRYLDVNEKACQILGYTRQELLSRRVTDIDPTVDQFQLAKVKETLERSGFRVFETVHQRKDGSTFPVEVSLRLARLEDDCVVGVARDITERKCAENRTLRLNRTLQSLSECTETLMKATDESTVLQQVCDSVVQVGGYRMAWVGYAEHDECKTVRPIAQAGFEDGYLNKVNISWADVERGRGPGGISIRTGKVVVCNDAASDPCVAPWREEALRRRYHSLIVLPLRNENEVFGVLAIYAAEAGAFDSRERRLLEQLANNMTYAILALRACIERKRAQEALRRSEQWQQFALQAGQMGALDIDLETGRGTWTPQLATILGLPTGFDGNLAAFLWEHVHPLDRSRTQEEFAKIAHNGEATDMEFRVTRPDGATRRIRWRGKVIQDTPGAVSRAVGVSIDVTERKRTEEELRRLSGQLLQLQDEERRKISRELHDSTGQNLTALAANLDEARKSIPNSNRKARKLVSESLKLTEDCIREVRTLSYLLHPPMLDATGLEDAVRHYVSGFSMRTGIHVDLQFSPCFKRLIPDVELALFRVLQESLINVQRHSNSKEARVRLECSSRKITLEIKDNGHGASLESLKQKGRYPFEVGVGIASMQERLESIGGNLEIVAGSSGTTVRATLLARIREDAKIAHSNS